MQSLQDTLSIAPSLEWSSDALEPTKRPLARFYPTEWKVYNQAKASGVAIGETSPPQSADTELVCTQTR